MVDYRNLYYSLVEHIKESDEINQELYRKETLEYNLGRVGSIQDVIRVIDLVGGFINELK